MVVSRKGHGRHWASALSCGSHGAKLGRICSSVPTECSWYPEPCFTQGRAPTALLGTAWDLCPQCHRERPWAEREGRLPAHECYVYHSPWVP